MAKLEEEGLIFETSEDCEVGAQQSPFFFPVFSTTRESAQLQVRSPLYQRLTKAMIRSNSMVLACKVSSLDFHFGNACKRLNGVIFGSVDFLYLSQVLGWLQLLPQLLLFYL